jgi:hypothetical protein
MGSRHLTDDDAIGLLERFLSRVLKLLWRNTPPGLKRRGGGSREGRRACPRERLGELINELRSSGVTSAPSDKGTAGLTVSCLAHSDVVGREVDIGKHMGSRGTAFSSDPAARM